MIGPLDFSSRSESFMTCIYLPYFLTGWLLTFFLPYRCSAIFLARLMFSAKTAVCMVVPPRETLTTNL